jgi:hypothetical protein
MTAEDMTEDFNIVIENPAVYYRHPAEIVTDPTLHVME